MDSDTNIKSYYEKLDKLFNVLQDSLLGYDKSEICATYDIFTLYLDRGLKNPISYLDIFGVLDEVCQLDKDMRNVNNFKGYDFNGQKCSKIIIKVIKTKRRGFRP